jgi:hypothetical protein
MVSSEPASAMRSCSKPWNGTATTGTDSDKVRAGRIDMDTLPPQEGHALYAISSHVHMD